MTSPNITRGKEDQTYEPISPDFSPLLPPRDYIPQSQPTSPIPPDRNDTRETGPWTRSRMRSTKNPESTTIDNNTIPQQTPQQPRLFPHTTTRTEHHSPPPRRDRISQRILDLVQGPVSRVSFLFGGIGDVG